MEPGGTYCLPLQDFGASFWKKAIDNINESMSPQSVGLVALNYCKMHQEKQSAPCSNARFEHSSAYPNCILPDTAEANRACNSTPYLNWDQAREHPYCRRISWWRYHSTTSFTYLASSPGLLLSSIDPRGISKAWQCVYHVALGLFERKNRVTSH